MLRRPILFNGGLLSTWFSEISRLWRFSFNNTSNNNNKNITSSQVLLLLSTTPTLILLLLSLSTNVTHGQIIIIPKTQVVEPFKNNPKWEDFKISQFDRLKVLGTLVANVWTLLDTITEPTKDFPLHATFAKYHVQAFVNFFKDSEARLVDENPYAILDPAVGIHTIESLYKLSKLPTLETLEQIKLKWMEVDSLALTIHNYFNETTTKILAGDPNIHEHVLKGKTETFPVFCTGENGVTTKNMTIEKISSTIDKDMNILGGEHHLIRGLVTILSSMTQSNVDNREELNYYCYGNNDYGVFLDIYDILADAALYLVLVDMKKLVLDVYLFTYAKFFDPSAVDDTVEERLRRFNDMVERTKRKIDFEYLEGSDYQELPHPPVFKCDKTPEEWGIPTQWGRNLTMGISPSASATYPYDPQAGPEKEDGNVGYIDTRPPMLEYVDFDKAYHGYIESEKVLNPRGDCTGTCRDYKRPTKTCEGKGIDCQGLRNSHCDSPDSNCMAKSQCPGMAKQCERTSSTVNMCHDQNENRFLNYLHFGDGRVLGTKKKENDTSDSEAIPVSPPTCEGEMAVARARWEMEDGLILNNPQYCELCLCTCMTGQNLEEQHYVNLEPAVSDANQGYIVSAVRFVQEDRILTLAVEQGKPIAFGDIDTESTQWVEPTKPDKTDVTKAAPLGGLPGFVRMHFDIVTGEAHQVVTGVRFKLEEESLLLEVQVTPISWPHSDPSAITLHAAESEWIGAQEYHMDPAPLKFYKPNAPSKQLGPSMPDVVYNSYVEFTTSDYESDVAQSTIPFFDTQPVSFYETRRWLQGVGVFHKGKPESGGFIAPLVVPSKGKKSSLDVSNSKTKS